MLWALKILYTFDGTVSAVLVPLLSALPLPGSEQAMAFLEANLKEIVIPEGMPLSAAINTVVSVKEKSSLLFLRGFIMFVV